MFADAYDRVRRESERLAKEFGTSVLPEPLIVIDTDAPRWHIKEMK